MCGVSFRIRLSNWKMLLFALGLNVRWWRQTAVLFLFCATLASKAHYKSLLPPAVAFHRVKGCTSEKKRWNQVRRSLKISTEEKFASLETRNLMPRFSCHLKCYNNKGKLEVPTVYIMIDCALSLNEKWKQIVSSLRVMVVALCHWRLFSSSLWSRNQFRRLGWDFYWKKCFSMLLENWSDK